MTTILITIGLALFAIVILIVAYLETQEERELNAMYQRSWLCEERLKSEKAVALEALHRILDIGADHKVDEIALDAIRSIRKSECQRPFMNSSRK